MDPQIQAPVTQVEKPIVPSSAPKRIMFMLIAVIVVLFGTTSYLAFQNYQLRKLIGKSSTSPFPTSSPISDPTTDWETYVNETFNYSIKYPPEWNVYHSLSDPSTVSLEHGSSKNGQGSILIDVGAKKLKVTEPIEKWASDNNIEIDNSDTNQTIGGEKVIKTIGKSASNFDKVYNYFFTHNKTVYRINTSILNYQNGGSKVFDQILSTFKFTGTSDKETRSLFLKKVDNKEYKLEWEAFDINENERNYDNPKAQSNMESLVRLVSSTSGNPNSTIIKNLDLKLNSINPQGYFEIISLPASSQTAYLSQGVEGTDGMGFYVINLTTGKLFFPSEVTNNYGVCDDLPFGGDNQRFQYFSCGSILHKLDIVTEKVSEVTTLNSSESFQCVFEWGNVYSYNYSKDGSVMVNICDTNKKIVRSLSLPTF